MIMRKMKFVLVAVLAVFVVAGCSGEPEKKKDSSDSEAAAAVKDNVFTRQAALCSSYVEKVNAASSIEELKAVNAAFEREYDDIKFKSAKEILGINEELAKNPKAYEADIAAEKAAWDAYEGAYLEKRSQLRK